MVEVELLFVFKPSFFYVCTVYVCIYLFGVIVPTCQITCFQKVEPAVKQKKRRRSLVCFLCALWTHVWTEVRTRSCMYSSLYLFLCYLMLQELLLGRKHLSKKKKKEKYKTCFLSLFPLAVYMWRLPQWSPSPLCITPSWLAFCKCFSKTGSQEYTIIMIILIMMMMMMMMAIIINFLLERQLFSWVYFLCEIFHGTSRSEPV